MVVQISLKEEVQDLVLVEKYAVQHGFLGRSESESRRCSEYIVHASI
jgi:hypothetical protein